MFNLSTTKDTVKYLVQTYGPLFPATATTIAALVAAFAARAAMRSARASEMSMELGNRAYITIKDIKFTQRVTANVVPRVRIKLQNVGKTQAKFGRLRNKIELVENEFTDKVPEAKSREGEISFGPDHQIMFETYLVEPITDQQMANLNNGTLFLYFWGEFYYKDVFNHEHKTSWCVHYTTLTSGQLANHSHHNDMT